MIQLNEVYEIFGFPPDSLSEVTRSRGRAFIETLMSETNLDPDTWPELEFLGGL
jgi:hypothetical protein